MPSFPQSLPRITPRDSFYKAIDPDTGLGLRVCRSRPRLDRLDVCTWFRSRHQAEHLIATMFGASTLEIVRVDA